MGIYPVGPQLAGIRVILPASNAVCVTPVIPIVASEILVDVAQGFVIAVGTDPQGISTIKNEIKPQCSYRIAYKILAIRRDKNSITTEAILNRMAHVKGSVKRRYRSNKMTSMSGVS
jgi:hypothetical protein